MSKPPFRYSVWKLATLALFGMVVMLCCGTLTAQEKGQAKEELLDAPRAKSMTLLRAGYTRPGNPNDMIKDGKVFPVAWDDDYKGRYLGGTVYFAVYERAGSGAAGDTFGTGFVGIDDLFKEGRGSTGQFSPAFDRNARYLYVYMVVNDRGLDPKKEILIGDKAKNFRSEDVITTTVKLMVDPREITSWGHFPNVGFAARQVDRDLHGKEQPAADGKGDRNLLMAYSSNPSVLDSLPYKEYLAISPALALPLAKNSFAIERSNLNLKNAKAYKELMNIKTKEKDVKLVSWQENMLTAAKGGMEPTYVNIQAADGFGLGGAVPMFGFAGDGMDELLPVGKNPARGYLRVDWRGDQIVKLGEHSVIFGFTSNLPPADEVVRLISAVKEGAANATDISAMALIDGNGPGVGAGQVVGPGTVPTPVGSSGTGGVGSGNWLGGQIGGFGGGGFGGGGFGGGFGGIGGARAPLLGGGGGGFGGGSGNGNGNGQNPNANTGQQVGSQNQIVNINIALTNQQAQFLAQAQAQAQLQGQQQSQNCCDGCDGYDGHKGNVVPEPTAIALGLMGLPVLYLALRRRKASIPSLVPNS